MKKFLIKIYLKIQCFLTYIRIFFYNPEILYVGSVKHGNVGDQAICFASLKWCKEKLHKKILDVFPQELGKCVIKIIKKRKCVIALRGGGNIGTTWLHEEKFHRKIISTFSENKIVFFPESVYFSEDEFGINEAAKSARIYNDHPDLTLLVRDQISFERAKSIFNCKIIFCPDIVLSLKSKKHYAKNVKKVLVICRDDREQSISLEEKNKLFSYLLENKFEINYSTTLVNKTIYRFIRRKTIYKKLKEISSYDLVVTDRLHGLIFSYICGVPCIAIDNCNKKVSSASSILLNSKIVNFYSSFSKSEISNFLNTINLEDENDIDLMSKFDILSKLFD